MSKSRLTLRQAAKELGVSLPTIRRMVERGQLPGELHPGPFGDRWEIPQTALRPLKARGEVVEAAHPEAGEVADPPQGEAGDAGVAPQAEVGEVPDPPHGEAGDAGEAVQAEAGEAPEAARSVVGEVAEAPQREVGETGLLALHARALEVASKALDRARELEAHLASEQELRLRAERQTIQMAAELSQYRRALTETADSLAEERARVRTLELAGGDRTPPQAPSPQDVIESLPLRDASRPGWGRRLRKWLLGDKTG